MPQDTTTDYINTSDYKKLAPKFKELVKVMDDERSANQTARDLRYVEIDIEGERGRGKLQPDELLIPQHLIDTNIRREQAAYVQYDTQSPRAVILQDIDNPAANTQQLEKDVTNRIRYEGWQISKFANIDGMQQNGYGVMELIMDQSKSGGLAHEAVTKGDFGMPRDTKDIQEAEMVVRNYYFSRTRLLEMVDDATWKFDAAQVKKVIDQNPDADSTTETNINEKSLFRIQKVMYRVKGVVHVAWTSDKFSDNWLRAPRPLYIGRRKLKEMPIPVDILKSQITGRPPSEEVFETSYPYFMFPYLISENNTISQLKGRAFLDQDCQQAVMSIVSSYVTGLRRSCGLYFSKDVDDPNDDILMQKNIFFRSGALINSKVKSFQLQTPPSDSLSAVNLLISQNQQETSQVNFAAQNRKDSRKTATEISAATQQAAQLSTVQVVLYSNACRQMSSVMFDIIRSRVLTGMIRVSPVLQQLYSRNYSVRPSGDVDVIERQQLIQMMMGMWPIIGTTPAASVFLMDMLSKMFPENASRYNEILQQAQEAATGQQAQQKQQLLEGVKKVGEGVIHLSEHPEYFSDVGDLHALPVVKRAADQIKQTMEMIGTRQ